MKLYGFELRDRVAYDYQGVTRAGVLVELLPGERDHGPIADRQEIIEIYLDGGGLTRSAAAALVFDCKLRHVNSLNEGPRSTGRSPTSPRCERGPSFGERDVTDREGHHADQIQHIQQTRYSE